MPTNNLPSNSSGHTEAETSGQLRKFQLPRYEADFDGRIECWRLEADPAVEEPEGTVEQIFVSCLDALNPLIEQSNCSQRQSNSLQRCHGTLQLWAHQHRVYGGNLDARLQRSASVRQTLLELLLPLFKTTLRGRHLLAIWCSDTDDVRHVESCIAPHESSVDTR